MNQFHVIHASRLFDGQRLRRRQRLVLKAGKVVSLGSIMPGDQADVVLGANALLMPALVDLQVNGGGGLLLNDAPSADSIRRIVAVHRARGTHFLMPTLITDAPEAMQKLEADIKEIASIPGVIGLHLEGPHLQPARKGIHPAHHMRAMEEADIAQLLRLRAHLPILVTLAPDVVPPPIIRRLVDGGIRVSAGHSDVTYDGMHAATEAGLSGVTHLFNAMSQITPRAPGLVGTALTSDRIMAGIITDGFHVADQNVRLAHRAMGPDRLFLVSDAMATIGSDITNFRVGDRLITRVNDRLTGDEGQLAGAHIDMVGSIAHAVRRVGLPLVDVLRMATRTPATFMGLADQIGAFVPGAMANWISLDRDFTLKRTSLSA